MNHKLIFGILGLIFMIGMIVNSIYSDYYQFGIRYVKLQPLDKLMEVLFGITGFAFLYWLGCEMDKKMEEENENISTVPI